MFKSLNKAISTPIAIIIVIVAGLLAIGGVLAYQYLWQAPEEEIPIETPETTPTDETAGNLKKETITGEISLLDSCISGWAVFDGKDYYFMSGEKAEEIIDNGEGSRIEIIGTVSEKEELTSEGIKEVKIIEISSYKVLHSTYGSLGIGVSGESECERKTFTSEGVKVTVRPKTAKGFICWRPSQLSFYCEDISSYNRYYFLDCSPYISYFNCGSIGNEKIWNSLNANLTNRGFECSATASKTNIYKEDYRYHPELLQKQFQILEEASRVDFLSNDFKERIKSELDLFVSSIYHVELIFNPNLNSQGLRLICWSGSDMALENYCYQTFFLKDDKVITVGFDLFEVGSENLEWAYKQIEGPDDWYPEKWNNFGNRIIEDVENKDESSPIYQIVKEYDSRVKSINLED